MSAKAALLARLTHESRSASAIYCEATPELKAETDVVLAALEFIGNAMPNLRDLLEYSVQAEVAQVDLRASAYLKPKPQEASISRAL